MIPGYITPVKVSNKKQNDNGIFVLAILAMSFLFSILAFLVAILALCK